MDSISSINKEKTTDKNVGLKLNVTTLQSCEKFQCKANEIYDALTKSEMVTAFTRSYVKLDATKGGEYVKL